jgi:hypothetical protein
MPSSQYEQNPHTFESTYRQAAEVDLKKAGLSKETLIEKYEEALWEFRISEDLNPGAGEIRACNEGEDELGPTAEHWINLATQWPPVENLGGIDLKGVLIESLQVAIQTDYRSSYREDFTYTNYTKSIPMQMMTEAVASTLMFTELNKANDVLETMKERGFSCDRLISDRLQSAAGTDGVKELMLIMLDMAQHHPEESYLSDEVLSSALRYSEGGSTHDSAKAIVDYLKKGLEDCGHENVDLTEYFNRMIGLSQAADQNSYTPFGPIKRDECYEVVTTPSFEERWSDHQQKEKSFHVNPTTESYDFLIDRFFEKRSDFYSQLVKEDWRNFEPILDRSPNHQKLANGASLDNGLSIAFLSEEYMNYGVLKQAVNQNGLALQFIPEVLRTESIVMDAISQNPKAIMFVEERNITDEIRQCAANWRPEQISLSVSAAAARAASIESGMNTPEGNLVNANGEPTDLRVPAELQQVVDQPKQHRSDSPRL